MSRPQVAIIDYGMGNVFSVARAIEYCGADVICTRSAQEILSATHVILPGVGAFQAAMQTLDNYALIDVIFKLVEIGKPFLGICLGMQLLLGASEEFGSAKGLNIIQGQVIPISGVSDHGRQLKVPHIGWARLHTINKNAPIDCSRLLSKIVKNDFVYFAHSFQVQPLHQEIITASYHYGENSIVAMIEKDNILGCQFHPEKSGPVGLKILSYFLQGRY